MKSATQLLPLAAQVLSTRTCMCPRSLRSWRCKSPFAPICQDGPESFHDPCEPKHFCCHEPALLIQGQLVKQRFVGSNSLQSCKAVVVLHAFPDVLLRTASVGVRRWALGKGRPCGQYMQKPGTDFIGKPGCLLHKCSEIESSSQAPRFMPVLWRPCMSHGVHYCQPLYMYVYTYIYICLQLFTCTCVLTCSCHSARKAQLHSPNDTEAKTLAHVSDAAQSQQFCQ